MPGIADQVFQLQSVDSRLRSMRLELGELERAAIELRSAVEAKRPVVQLARQEMAGLEKRRREIEMKLAEDEEKTKDRRMRMQRIRNEKELSALRREIDLTKTEDATLEEELLGIFETGESKTTALKAMEEDLTLQEAELEKREQQHRERTDALRTEMEKCASERAVLAAALDEGLRRRYELIFERKGGIAVVEVRNGDCSGCHMRIPPQLITQIHRNVDIVYCPSCQRILFHS